jgi:glutamyl-tRNA reductase
MWQELGLVHRKADAASSPFPAHSGATWKTCLRELFFAHPGDGFPPGDAYGGDRYVADRAHRFLVEICSGLHSPLFGETEVFGQFRAFRAGAALHPAWDELLDAVEEDVRKLRRTHLTDIGSQSYGSLARRHLPGGEPVVIVGAGHLAQELLPWLDGHEVTVAARNPSRVSFVQAVPMESLARAPRAHWLIAAPVTNAQLEAWWATNPALTVLDFRGETSFLLKPERCLRYLALRALYAELETVRALHAKKRDAALTFAHELSLRRASAVVHRPYGWEDAFA